MKTFLRYFCILFIANFSYANTIDSLFQTEVASFTDSLVELQIKDKIAGATVSIVKDGEIIYLKGYGLADVENEIPVNKKKHLFRIGSISKMFVWTSIMQLVQAGKINLDDDIGDHIDLGIPKTFESPITIKDLMTHSPGFEDRVIGLFGRNAKSIRPIEEILKDQFPERVFPAGIASSYSNHGTGMAQYIVEKVSGMDFNDYVQKYILSPLEMKNTTFQQPVPGYLEQALSKGYVFSDDDFQAMDFEYIPMIGVGGCSSTAEDMAHFMIAHLQKGAFNDQQILDSATATLMQSPAFYNHPKVNPMRYGFMDVSQNGVTIIGHGGDTGWFHSFMTLYPDDKVGVFISYNSQAGGPAYMKFVECFTDRFFPEEVEAIESSMEIESVKKYAGFYMSNRYPRTTMAKIARLAINVTLEVTSEGLLKTDIFGVSKHWIPVDEQVFRDKNSSEILVFEKDRAGKVANLCIGNLPIVVLEKATGLDNPYYHLIILIILAVFILFTFIFWIIKYFIRKSKRSQIRQGMLPANPKRLAFWITTLWILFMITFITTIATDPLGLVYEVPFFIKVSLIFPILIAVLLVVLTYYVLATWRNSKVKFINKLYLTLLFVVYSAGIWLLNYWNLLGFKY